MIPKRVEYAALLTPKLETFMKKYYTYIRQHAELQLQNSIVNVQFLKVT